jgi:hypothetical protein
MRYDFSQMDEDELAILDGLLDRCDAGEELSPEEHALVDNLMEVAEAEPRREERPRRRWGDTDVAVRVERLEEIVEAEGEKEEETVPFRKRSTTCRRRPRVPATADTHTLL